jgi:hypothetical protein
MAAARRYDMLSDDLLDVLYLTGPGPYDDDDGESRWKPGTSPQDTDPEEEEAEEGSEGGTQGAGGQ